VGFGEGEGDKVTFGVVALVEVGVGVEAAVFEVGVGVRVTVSVGVGVTVSVGVGVGDVSSDLKVAMQPAQEVDKKFVPEFAVSLVVDTLVNSASDTYVPNAFACPLDKA
jgi:hypothetical protein